MLELLNQETSCSPLGHSVPAPPSRLVDNSRRVATNLPAMLLIETHERAHDVSAISG